MMFFTILIKFLFVSNLKLEDVFINNHYYEINGNIVIPPVYELDEIKI